ncbi:unnamed protein product [Zymoseptoria tritici ST99CH_1A5]|uniref:Uncharacterized protein n=1 Tax=Zymoseptoria tritici ST99CH_1A5 TaxID=1276529 RepID=A0A1Y6M0P4_ZYMTR|nr:unnamed protein product [Zymoseptoria tritici ST99CH_1A5]
MWFGFATALGEAESREDIPTSVREFATEVTRRTGGSPLTRWKEASQMEKDRALQLFNDSSDTAALTTLELVKWRMPAAHRVRLSRDTTPHLPRKRAHRLIEARCRHSRTAARL